MFPLHVAHVFVLFSDMCTASCPFIMLSDILDCLTLDKCAEVFAYIEERLEKWKTVCLLCINESLCCYIIYRSQASACNNVVINAFIIFVGQISVCWEKLSSTDVQWYE